MTNSGTPVVLLTDHAWPDDTVERSVVEGAGFTLVTGPAEPAPAEQIEHLAKLHRPQAVLTCWAPVTGEAIAQSPDLRIVARLGVGLDNIAVDAATRRGIWVTNVPDYCVEEVSDHAVGMVLAWSRGLVSLDRAVRAGEWNPAGAHLRRLSELTCGVVGFGRIGRATVRKLAAFGAPILVSDPALGSDASGFEPVSLDELLVRSDVVILHAPLTEKTRHLIGAAELAMMPRGSLLVNVSRGGLVDTAAVIAALDEGRLGAVALDVLESEPDVPDALRENPNAILTPHVAFSSDASVIELRRRAAEEVVRVLRGESPCHPCNRPVGAPETGAAR